MWKNRSFVISSVCKEWIEIFVEAFNPLFIKLTSPTQFLWSQLQTVNRSFKRAAISNKTLWVSFKSPVIVCGFTLVRCRQVTAIRHDWTIINTSRCTANDCSSHTSLCPTFCRHCCLWPHEDVWIKLVHRIGKKILIVQQHSNKTDQTARWQNWN